MGVEYPPPLTAAGGGGGEEVEVELLPVSAGSLGGEKFA